MSTPYETDWDREIRITARQEHENAAGAFELIEMSTPGIQYTFPEKTLILNNLQLIYGIGATTAAKLKTAGYLRIDHLFVHPRWGNAATYMYKAIMGKEVDRLARYGATDLELLGFFAPREITFLDIETLGFCNMYPVFLIGLLRFESQNGKIRQLLARNYGEERAILAELSPDLRNQGVIVSYNGRSFDIPYLRGRLRVHGLEDRFDAFHLDLLRHTRRMYRSVLPDCRLVTVEQCLLNEERKSDLPGFAIPEEYQKYMDSGDEHDIDPILKHNASDLLSMAKYLGIITRESRNEGR